MRSTYCQDPSKPELCLSHNACHLWQIPLSPGYVNLLTKSERGRYDRITHPATRNDYAASQAGLRAVLARYVNYPPDAVLLHRRERGKPFLPTGPEFNLSHSNGLVFVAVAAQPVGLDIERADREVAYTGLAAKFFSAAEQARIVSAPSCDRGRWFLRFWVCKEAVVKLSGDGIFRGLRDGEVVFGADDSAAGHYRGRPVRLQVFEPAPGCLAALASWEPLNVEGWFRL
jgi:4'-phosphopantetheinyl transferase